jgi:hypothetical protein
MKQQIHLGRLFTQNLIVSQVLHPTGNVESVDRRRGTPAA